MCSCSTERRSSRRPVRARPRWRCRCRHVRRGGGGDEPPRPFRRRELLRVLLLRRPAGRRPLHQSRRRGGTRSARGALGARDVSPEVVWAAIDCSGAYAVGGPGRGEVVLGRMAAEIHRLPEEGERCVVVAWPLGEDGRKLYAGTALLGRTASRSLQRGRPGFSRGTGSGTARRGSPTRRRRRRSRLSRAHRAGLALRLGERVHREARARSSHNSSPVRSNAARSA